MESVSHGYAVRLVTDKNIGNLSVELQNRFKVSVITSQSDHSLVVQSEQRIPLFPVLEFLHDRKIEVHEARELRPSLEDVFVKLTGIESCVMKKDKEKGDKR